MTYTMIIGLAAAIFTTGSWIPQAIRTVRTRSAGDISWPYLIAFTLGVAFWGIYGFLQQDVAIIAANITTFAFLVPIHWVKITTKTR